MADKVRIGANTVYVYVPGAIVQFRAYHAGTGQYYTDWEILTTSLTWDQFGQIAQTLTIVPVDDEGEQLTEQAISVDSDKYDIVEL
jgi:hypothetical protein